MSVMGILRAVLTDDTTSWRFRKMAQIWTLANLSPEQERLLKEAEGTLGDNILLAYAPNKVEPAPLNESQQECLEGLEKNTGLVVLAVRPK
jgi:hypothetical protein